MRVKRFHVEVACRRHDAHATTQTRRPRRDDPDGRRASARRFFQPEPKETRTMSDITSIATGGFLAGKKTYIA
ncbi:MAG: hypothetical protein ACREB6_06515, partial [Rhodospirillales bacterium]